MPIRKVKTEIPVHRMFATRFLLRSFHYFSLACWVLMAGCSGHASQSTAPLASAPATASASVRAPARPTLTELTPNLVHVGNSGTLILRGTNFVPGTTIRTPPGLDLRNIQVNNPTQITADYTIGPNSWLGFLNVTVTTPGGTSEPARFAIYPAVFQFGIPANGASAKPAAPAKDGPVYESFDVGIHAGQVANPDGSQTDAYLDVSFTDEKGHPVAVGDSYHGDMDNVDNPDASDDSPDSGEPTNVTSYSFGLQTPAEGKYVLHIKSSRVRVRAKTWLTARVEVRARTWPRRQG